MDLILTILDTKTKFKSSGLGMKSRFKFFQITKIVKTWLWKYLNEDLSAQASRYSIKSDKKKLLLSELSRALSSEAEALFTQ